MAEKKYYWLKLQKDFFKRHDIKIIKSRPNGKDYVIFYLSLLLESIDHNGELRFSDTIPYNEEMLSVITDTNIDIVRSAMKILTELKMVELLDDSTIFMTEVNKMIGCETKWAEKKRIYRQKSQPKIEDNTQQEIKIDTKKDDNTINNTTNKEVKEKNFAMFWKAYPRKINKANALKTFNKIDVKLFDTIMIALENHKKCEQWTKDNGKYIPHASTWLNAKRWEDELETESNNRNYEIIPDKEGKIF